MTIGFWSSFSHEEVINSLPGNTNLVTEIFHECSTLLSTLFELMTALESSTTPLARAFSLISEAMQTLRQYAEQCTNDEVSECYGTSVQIVTAYLLQSTYDLPQLAYVLTPRGRKHAQSQLVTGVRGLERLLYCDVESEWKNYHIITFPG